MMNTKPTMTVVSKTSRAERQERLSNGRSRIRAVKRNSRPVGSWRLGGIEFNGLAIRRITSQKRQFRLLVRGSLQQVQHLFDERELHLREVLFCVKLCEEVRPIGDHLRSMSADLVELLIVLPHQLQNGFTALDNF